MPDINSTVGSASANSFVSEDEFDSYLETVLNAATYTTANKQKALIEATRDLSLLNYIGERVDTTQKLSWPRSDAVNPDAPWVALVSGDTPGEYAEDVIPDRVKDATCELAYQYLLNGTLAAQDSTASIKSESVGPISVTYNDPQDRAQKLSKYDRVMNYVRPLIRASSVGLQMSRV